MEEFKNLLYDALIHACTSCSKNCIKKMATHEHVYMQGCYPWQCVHATLALKDHPDAGIREAVKDNDMAFTPCPLTEVDMHKGRQDGCLMMDRDGTWKFCPYGVRRVDIVPKESHFCCLAADYSFSLTADLKYGGVGIVLDGLENKDKLHLNPNDCVLVLATSTSPIWFRGQRYLTDEEFETIVYRMSVFGYKEDGGVWRKRTIVEQNKWIATCRYRYRCIVNDGKNPNVKKAEATKKGVAQ